MKPFLLIPLLTLVLGCSGNRKHAVASVEHGESTRTINLKRAAALPWRDNGHCVVKEASNEWRVVVERCFDALDTSSVRLQDPERVCAVANADAATLGRLVGICILAQPQFVVGAVIVIGVVVVAAEIAKELAERERCRKVAEGCREACSETSLPSGDYGFRFWNCVNACMEKQGCPPGT
jgi:hypothetical protein